MNKQIRVRYAPSPTGHIHIGNARSALFNYLFARHNNGVLVMRLDDTDRKRSTDEAINTMLNDIQWLGIDWDEGYLKGGDHGPYRQTERMDLYNHYIDILLSDEKAYELYYTEEEIHNLRDSYEKEGKKFSYKDLKEKETEQLRNAFKNKNLKPAIVFRVEKDEEIIVNDLVRGNVTFNSNEFKDFVIRRENGIPVYNYATVIDDALMKITHIIRAEEHLSNTPKQLFIFNALNFPPPQFAHISLILAPDRTKLSKRDGATSVGQYREMGFLPEALLNYLALLGWSSKDDREFFTKEELINLFTLESVNKAPAIFDIDKLKWMNHHYMENLSTEEIIDRAKLINIDFSGKEMDWWREFVGTVKEHLIVLKDIEVLSRPFFEIKKEIMRTKEKTSVITRRKLAPLIAAKSLKKGDKVALIGFGTFGTRKRFAKSGVNLRTRKKIKIAAKTVSYFRAGKNLKKIDLTDEESFNISGEKVFFLREEVLKKLKEMDALPLLGTFKDNLSNISDWSKESVLTTIRSTGKEMKMKGRSLYFPLRLAITGSEEGLEIHEFIFFLKKEDAIKRLNYAIEELNKK